MSTTKVQHTDKIVLNLPRFTYDYRDRENGNIWFANVKFEEDILVKPEWMTSTGIPAGTILPLSSIDSEGGFNMYITHDFYVDTETNNYIISTKVYLTEDDGYENYYILLTNGNPNIKRAE